MLVSSGFKCFQIKPGGGLAREVIHFMSSVQFWAVRLSKIIFTDDENFITYNTVLCFLFVNNSVI